MHKAVLAKNRYRNPPINARECEVWALNFFHQPHLQGDEARYSDGRGVLDSGVRFSCGNIDKAFEVILLFFPEQSLSFKPPHDLPISPLLLCGDVCGEEGQRCLMCAICWG